MYNQTFAVLVKTESPLLSKSFPMYEPSLLAIFNLNVNIILCSRFKMVCEINR
jgi:hypothetical protein